MENFDMFQYFGMLVTSIPKLLIFLVLVVLAIVKIKQRTAHSMVVILASLILATYILVWPIHNLYLNNLLMAGTISSDEVRAMLAQANIVFSFFESVAWLLVAFAIFGWRKNQPGEKS